MTTSSEPDAPPPAGRAPRAHMLESIAQEASDFVRDARLPFQRGEPLDFFRKMAHLGAALTLPIVPEDRWRAAVSLKVLYSLWNVVVDDEIDRQQTTTGLDASMAYLAGCEPCGGDHLGGARAVLDRMARQVPGGRISRTDPLGFDLWEVVTGLGYELFINVNPRLATPFEYRRHSVTTASVKVDLDIDCLFAVPALEPSRYRTMREGYDELGSAVKLAGDIGTVRREVYEENNLSLLRILADNGSQPCGERRSPEDVMRAALDHRAEVEVLAREHLRRASELFSSVPEVDTSGLLRAVSRVVNIYASGVDPFVGSGDGTSAGQGE